MTDRTVPPAQQCFLCLSKLADGREVITVGLGFDVHRDCYYYESDEADD